jgi:hypothetical protein
VLTTHVVTGARSVAEITASAEITTLSGVTLSPFGRTLIDADPTLPDARIIAGRADLEASNGIVQAVNRVILPADIPEARGSEVPRGTIADIVAASGEGPDNFGADFDLLNAALRATGLDAALDDPAARAHAARADRRRLRLARAVTRLPRRRRGGRAGGHPRHARHARRRRSRAGADRRASAARHLRPRLARAAGGGRRGGSAGGRDARLPGRDILDAEPSLEAEFIGGGERARRERRAARDQRRAAAAEPRHRLTA